MPLFMRKKKKSAEKSARSVSVSDHSDHLTTSRVPIHGHDTSQRYSQPTLPYDDIRPEGFLQPGFKHGEDGNVYYECEDLGSTYENPKEGTSADSLPGPAIPPRSTTRISVNSVESGRVARSGSSCYSDSSDSDNYLNMPDGEDYQNPDVERAALADMRQSVDQGGRVRGATSDTTAGYGTGGHGTASNTASSPSGGATGSSSGRDARGPGLSKETARRHEDLLRGKRMPKYCIDATKVLPSVFEYPSSVAVSPINGDIYITDQTLNQIIRLHKSGRKLDTIGGPGRGPGELSRPSGVILTPEGHVIVSDQLNHRVQVFSGNGKFLREFGREGSGMGEFRKPGGLALSEDTDIIYVADQWNNRVQLWTRSGTFIKAFGELGTGKCQFKQPQDVTVDMTTGDVIIADTNNSRIVRVTREGKYVATIGQPGASKGQLAQPKAVAVDKFGYIAVADDHNFRVQIFSPSGEFVHSFGSKGDEPGEFDELVAIAISPDDRDILVVDYYNRRIQVF